MIISSFISAFSCAVMEVLMYLLLLIKNTEAAASYLSLLPLLILVLLAGTIFAIRRNGSMEIWIAANGILAIGSAAYSLNGVTSGISLKYLLLASFAASIIFFWLSKLYTRHTTKKYSWIIPWIMSLGILIVMCFFGKDPENRGTITGIMILGHSVMLTEFVKIAAALFYATLFSKPKGLFDDNNKITISTLYFISCSGLLVYMNELGTILVLLILHVLCIFLFIENSVFKIGYLLFVAACIAAAGVFLIWIYPRITFSAAPLTKLYNRLVGCFWPEKLDPYDEGYSVIQSIRSILLGGLFGTSSLSVALPEASNDFIYAYVMNNFGTMFGLIIFGLYVFIAIFGLKNALKMRGFQKILYCSFVILFTTQSLYNISMNCNFLPICGITCCLLSRGGTSLLVSMMMIVYMVASKPEEVAS